MRAMLAALATLCLATPALAAGQIACSQIPAAQHFVDGLKPGPNTKAAQQHLDAAKKAKSDQECVTELGHVNYYAKRSAAADKRVASAAHKSKKSKRTASAPHRAGAVQCADAMHQNRPGGSDYKGPPVAGCKRVP